MVKGVVTYPHLLQRLGQHIATLLLVDEDDDGRLEATGQNLQQLLPASTGHRSAQQTHEMGTFVSSVCSSHLFSPSDISRTFCSTLS